MVGDGEGNGIVEVVVVTMERLGSVEMLLLVATQTSLRLRCFFGECGTVAMLDLLSGTAAAAPGVGMKAEEEQEEEERELLALGAAIGSSGSLLGVVLLLLVVLLGEGGTVVMLERFFVGWEFKGLVTAARARPMVSSREDQRGGAE